MYIFLAKKLMDECGKNFENVLNRLDLKYNKQVLYIRPLEDYRPNYQTLFNY